MRLHRAVFTAYLPQTPCTPEMRQDFIRVAEGLGKGMAEAQRDAIGLFLAEFDTKAINHAAESISHLIEEEGQ